MSRARLEDEIRDRLPTRRLERDQRSALSTGISAGLRYTIDNDAEIFVKTNSGPHAEVMFLGERESLNAIRATKTIRAPEPYLVLTNYETEQNNSAIVMEYLPISTLRAQCAARLGQKLAHLHDYNNKVQRYSRRARTWIGREQPSARHVKEIRAAPDSESARSSANREPAVKDHDHDDDEGNEDEESEITFAKHSMRVKPSSGRQDHADSGPQVGALKLDDTYAQKFVPEAGADEAITQFGFHVPTSCGSIPQENEWTDDWVAFYARHRLDKPIRALLSEHSDRQLHQEWSQLQLKVDKFFADFKPREGDKIVPALLHGDLWSGNLAQLSDESDAVVYDPSSFYGHSEYDFGIARMFGAIPAQLESSYFELMPKRKLFNQRNKLYQFFHHLNHWQHFGSGYRASSLRLVHELNALV